MVEIPDRHLRGAEDLPPLPSYAEPREALRRALPALAPPVRLSVDQAAEQVRRVEASGYWLDWSNDVAPYMVEPQRMITSRRFGVLAFAGPARSVKTAALIENAIAHGITCQPRSMHLVQMTETAAREYSLEKIGPMLRNSPALAERQLKTRGADNLFEKRFRGGARLTIGWPVISQLSSRTLALVLFTDYDRMPEDVDGEGSPLKLGAKRTETLGSLGKVVVESSPGRPVADESWRPKTPHEGPPTTGILAIYNAGTRGRWYWPCPECGVEFEPRWECMHWPEDAPSPAAAGEAAYMACPECGGVIEHGQKLGLNRRGRWLHEGPAGELVPLEGAVRATDTVSYWLPGPAAAFAPWSALVGRWLAAKAQLEASNDEAELKSVTNLDLGLPYTPAALGDEEGLSEDRLRALADEHPAGVAPEWARFITVSVDVQANRFPCQVDAWGPDLERRMIDRFDLATPPEGAPRAGERALDPAKYDEDWQVLEPLVDRVWPVAGSDYGLRPVSIVVDMHGAKGATPRAYAFWRRRKRAGQGKVWHLVRGEAGLRRPRAVRVYPEGAHAGGRKKVARDVPIIRAGTDLLKDEIRASLLRTDPGSRAYRLSRALPEEVFAELAAERRTEKGWERKPGFRRNEALDLAVYGLALAIVLKAEKIDWTRPPAWADELARNSFAARLAAAPEDPGGASAEVAEAPEASPALKRRKKPRRRRAGGGPKLGGVW